MDVRKETVAGLPCWIGPAGTTHQAGIVFRVGQGDERIGTHGITHLVEHLAIHGAGPRTHPLNGFAGVHRCGFHAKGSPEEVWAFLRAVAATLHDLPMERLDAERRVLRAEQAPAGVGARLLEAHYGSAGPGLLALAERGLNWLGPDELRAWSDRHFTAGNAVLWSAGEPPADLPGLGLPAGPAVAEPVFDPIPPAFPVFHTQGTGGVMLGMVAERSSALGAAAGILGRRLMDAIRTEAGLGYAPHTGHERLSATHAHLLAGSDCADHHAPQVLATVWDAVRRLAADGPDPAELERHRADVRRNIDAGVAADGAAGLVALMAEDEVAGGAPKDHAELMANLDALTPAAVAAALAAALETAILIGPAGSSPPRDGFVAPREAPAPVTDGSRYERGRRGDRQTVVLGPGGLTLTRADAPPVTITAAWAEGVASAPDGSLTPMSRDGQWCTIYPDDFDAGEALAAGLRDLAGGRVFPIGDARHCADVERLAARAHWQPETDPRPGLHWLPGVLRDDETLRLLAGAMRRPEGVLRHYGIVAVTDRRLIWHGPQESVAFELADVRRVRSRVLADLAQKLIRVDLPDERDWRLTVPRKAEPQLLDAVRAGMAADSG